MNNFLCIIRSLRKNKKPIPLSDAFKIAGFTRADIDSMSGYEYLKHRAKILKAMGCDV